jgi:hypothetical protein
MIVNAVKEGWEIIYQQEHGLLAAELALHWRPDQRPVYWMATLAAIAQHDDGQEDWSGKDGITPAGAPADFTQVPFSLEQARQVLHEARFQGRWRSLLTSMHLSFLHEPLRGSGDKRIDTLLDEQLSQQKSWRQALGVTLKQARHAYCLMQWCDRLSLILCRNELPDRERSLEISAGPDNSRYYVRQRQTGSVEVDPWPFEDSGFQVSVEASYLSQLQFRDDAELADALRQAPVKTKTWYLKKG